MGFVPIGGPCTRGLTRRRPPDWSTLTQAQIPFDVGSTVQPFWFLQPQLDKARLATAVKGGVKSGRMGFELFDKPNWVGSEFDEQVNYQRALEGELEHTVGTLCRMWSPHGCTWCCRMTLFFAKRSALPRLRWS